MLFVPNSATNPVSTCIKNIHFLFIYIRIFYLATLNLVNNTCLYFPLRNVTALYCLGWELYWFSWAVHSFWEWGYIKSFYNNAAFKTLFWFWMLVHNKILSTVIFFFFFMTKKFLSHWLPVPSTKYLSY